MTDQELIDDIGFYRRERARSILAANDRTEGSVPFCEYKLEILEPELARRRELATRFKEDPLGSRFEGRRDARYKNLIALAETIKSTYPIERFMVELMGVRLIPSGRDRWKCSCVSPAHRDRTPSMTVFGGSDPHVHCYGCGLHMDMFDLAKLVHGDASFRSAVKRIADAIGAGAAS
jgi:hypothetical protein